MFAIKAAVWKVKLLLENLYVTPVYEKMQGLYSQISLLSATHLLGEWGREKSAHKKSCFQEQRTSISISIP